MSGSTNGPPRSLEILAPRGSDGQPTAVAPGQPARGSSRSRAVSDLVDRLLGEVILQHAPGRRVLDLGHGSVRVADWVAPRAGDYAAVDAIDLGRGAEVSLPFRAGAFDLVYSLRTLPHLGRDDASSKAAAASCLAEVGRVTKPGGTALVQFINATSLWGLYNGVRNPLTAVERGPLIIESTRGLTRFDTLGRFKRMLPKTLHISRVHGARIFTLVPATLAIPIIGRVFEAAEWFARDRPLFNRLGASILVELRRVAT